MLHDAFVAEAAFGSEFVMTYGPWGFVATRAYYPGTFGWLLVAWLVIAVALWLGAFAVARAKIGNPALAAVWIVAVTLTSVVVETETAVIAAAALFLVVVFGIERTRTLVRRGARTHRRAGLARPGEVHVPRPRRRRDEHRPRPLAPPSRDIRLDRGGLRGLEHRALGYWRAATRRDLGVPPEQRRRLERLHAGDEPSATWWPPG